MSDETNVDPNNSKEEGEISVEDLQAKLAKSEEIAGNYKIRAEKAESKNKNKSEDKPAPKTEATEDQNLASTDMLALMGNNITEKEDVDYLQTVAKGYCRSNKRPNH